VQEPTPEQYNPPLTWRSHAWRTALALAVSALAWAAPAGAQWTHARPLFWLDLGVGLLCLALSFLRRRWPLGVAVTTAVLGSVSVSSAGPGLLAAVSLATRRVVWQILLVGVLSLTGSMLFTAVEPAASQSPWWIDFALGLAVTVAVLVWGMYLGSRRELLWTLRDRAHRAEAEQALRVEQGRSNERARIAREMHDVLAHRISLVTMHAGALAYRTDLSADEMRGTAELIQTKAHEALVDLRQVLGVLRDEPTADGLPDPQPTFDDLAALVAEAEESGMHIRYDDRVRDAVAMPEGVGRTTYRIVQEGLTNARKHAPGATVLVQVGGSPTDGVTIEIRNPAGTRHARGGAGTPGAGLGLVGLGERAKLAGGRLDTRSDGGSFELRGWLPWTP
jgi:signal transduction histidine kinase